MKPYASRRLLLWHLSIVICSLLVRDQTLNAELLDGIGAIGSSSTDEYEFESGSLDRSHARTWLEQLATTAGLNFGTFSTADRGEPRRQGYEFNWARSNDAATGSRPNRDLPNQLGGLMGQVDGGEVTLVYIGIGVNDFGFTSGIGQYLAIHNGTLAGDSLTAFINSYAIAIESAVDVVSSRDNVKIVLNNIYDFGDTPGVESVTNAEGRARVTEAVERANRQLQTIADTRFIPVIDAFGFSKLSKGSALSVGGVDISLRDSGPSPQNFFADSYHRGSVVQGLYANAFIEAINLAYAVSVTPMSDQQILLAAETISGFDLDFDPSVQTFFDISGFVHYIPDPAPLGDVNHDTDVNGLDVDPFVDVLLASRFDVAADMNGDGVVNGLDVEPFVAAVVGGTQQIPEPSTLLLALVALGLAGGLRKWKRGA